VLRFLHTGTVGPSSELFLLTLAEISVYLPVVPWSYIYSCLAVSVVPSLPEDLAFPCQVSLVLTVGCSIGFCLLPLGELPYAVSFTW
jgi:hypothetical protein